MDITTTNQITDLRRRVLENERAGKPAHEGIDPEEYRSAIAHLRGHRADAGAKGGKATATKAKAAKEAKAPSANLANLLADLGD